MIDIGVKNRNITSDSGEEYSSSDGSDSSNGSLKEISAEIGATVHRHVSQVD